MIKENCWEWRKCIKCFRSFKVRIKNPKQYCSRKCRNSDMLGVKNPNHNHKWTAPQKAMAKNRMVKRILLGEMPIYTDTKPHLKLEHLLQDLGFKVDKEVCFGGFFVDCYLPEFHIALEADGPFHSKIKDRKRDSFILENYNVPILRFEATVLMTSSKEKDIKDKILAFVNMYQGSTKEREKDSKLKEFGVIAVKNFKSWKQDKVRKLDSSTGVLYWVDKEYKQFICPTCGKNTLISETDKRKYCSSSCAANRPNRNLILKTVVCKGCNKVFTSDKWKIRKYCSQECYKKAKPSWNTGLTKQTSDKLKEVGQKISKAQIGKKKGKYEAYLSKSVCEQQKERIRESKCIKCGRFSNSLKENKLCIKCKGDNPFEDGTERNTEV